MLKMQDKTEFFDMVDQYIDLATMEYEDLDPAVVSDDVWKKFELDAVPPSQDEIKEIVKDLEIEEVPEIPEIPNLIKEVDLTELCNMLYHDCMWAGRCGNEEHCTEELMMFMHNKPQGPSPMIAAAVPAPGPEKTPAVKQQPVAPGRSVLLSRTVVKPIPVPVLPSPDSPPISDDEDPKGQTSTLKMLNDAINECDIEEDSDLCEYFGEDDDIVADEPEEAPAPPKPHFAPQNDHSYHKDKNASMRIANLGIETPSDSEEEIDVVSVGEKSRLGYGLPTNPSSQYQEHLERTVECAIGKKRVPTAGIKTLPPLRKSSTSTETSPIKKRLPESRGVKRSRHHHYGRSSSSSQPAYKRRAIQPSNGSDSEPEMEKRSLHNNMERQRRIDLRNAFEDLRKLVPRLSVMDRAAKVQILQDSRDYCYHLTHMSENYQKKVQDLRKQQERLRLRVSQLRRNLAAKR